MNQHPLGFLRRALASVVTASVLLSCSESGSTAPEDPKTVTVTPSAVTLVSIGAQASFTVTLSGTGMAGSTVTWNTSAPLVATVSNGGVVTAVSNGTATITASAQGASANVTVTVAQVTSSITVTPSASTLTSVGATQQLAAVARDANNNVVAAPTLTWSSSAATVATVNSSGLVTAAGSGNATITVSSGTASATAAITVAQAVSSVTVTPTPVTLASVGATQQLTAVARDANNNAISGATVTWSSSAPAAATVSASGLVTAVANGASTVSASVAGASGPVVGTASVTVAQVIASVAVTPATATLASFGATQQLAAAALDANGNAVAGATIVWTSVTPAVATVSAAGLVTSVANGSATVTAAVGAVSGSAVITVAQAVTEVLVTPATATIGTIGGTQQLTAVAEDANDNAIAGATFTWASSAPAVATVSTTGLVTSVASGSATITATSGGINGTAAITVGQTVTAVTVTPATATLTSFGGTQQLAAVATDAAAAVVVGATFTWTSSAPSVATVNSSGLVTSVANGSATITATSGGVNGTSTITVAQAVTSVAIAPTTVTLASFGATQQLTATARDAGSNTVAGAVITWSSSSPSVATVNSSGLVTAVANGSTTITATSGGVNGTRSVTVAQAVNAVTVTPTSASLVRDGGAQQLSAVARDANNNVIAGQAFSWTSSSTSVASVSSTGLVTSGNIGSATITVSAGGRSATSAITVTGVPMAWVLVTQASTTVQYTPLASEGTNLSGGSITVARFSTGRYAVVFGGLGTNPGRIGTNWTAMISTSLFQQAGLPVQGAVCNLNSLQVTDLRVDVWCENAASGAAMDAQFRVLVVGNGALAAPMAFTGHTNSAATTNYAPSTSLAFSSGGEAQTVGVGASEIVHSYGANVPGNNGVFVQTITPAQGSARTCIVRANSPSARTATIWCFNAVGTLDRNITHLFMAPSLGRVGGFQGFAAVNSNGTQQTSRNSSGGTVVTSRVGVGSYTVTFNGLSSPGLDGNFAVLVSSAGGAVWENCGHRVSNANPITVQVVCVNNSGTQVDAQAAFHVMVLR